MIPLRSPHLDVAIEAHGARIARMSTPDRDGRWGDVALGLAEDTYPADQQFLGATVGRFANRIADGTFQLDGRTYELPLNEPHATLHGGPDAFDHAEWLADAVTTSADTQSVTLRHSSPDGHNGFPGRLDVAITYTVVGSDLAIDLAATTDAPTIVNLTNHAYFNLRGAGCVDDHEITVFGDSYLPVDGNLIPDGAPAGVSDTPFDLRRPTRIGAHVRDPHPQLRLARGYDHCYVLHDRGPRSGAASGDLPAAAHVHDPSSGRTLTVFTDRPGLQFYSGNMLDGRTSGHDGRAIRQGDAFCLEPQHLPNSPNRPDFPSTILRPTDVYTARILFRLGSRPRQEPSIRLE